MTHTPDRVRPCLVVAWLLARSTFHRVPWLTRVDGKRHFSAEKPGDGTGGRGLSACRLGLFVFRKCEHIGNLSFTTWFLMCENSTMQTRGLQFEKTVLEALRDQIPVRGLPGVRIRVVKPQPADGFDVQFELESGKKRVLVLGEIKSAVSPRLLEQINPWIRRMKSLREGVSFALICPALSPRSQTFCIENGIDFLDLAGNVSVNVPGTFTLQRLGMKSKEWSTASYAVPGINVFSGRSSRVLRVLLEKPKPWTLTGIAKELQAETNRIGRAFSNEQVDFAIRLGTISKALASLEEQLWIRRQGSSILVPEPRRLLVAWAEKYKERYRWRLRNSFKTVNPFGRTLVEITNGLRPLLRSPYAFTAAAAATDAPFIDVDTIDLFLAPGKDDAKLRQLDQRSESGPQLRFIYPYDGGVFLYARTAASVPMVSNIQAYLDLYARGGRDLKQADYLLTNAIEPRWKST
jgi:hypothetical protein